MASQPAPATGRYEQQLRRAITTLGNIAITLITALIAILSIELNAWVTGVFLALELLVVLVVTVLGLTHVNQPITALVFPHTFDASGTASPLTLGLVLTGVAIGVYSYNG